MKKRKFQVEEDIFRSNFIVFSGFDWKSIKKIIAEDYPDFAAELPTDEEEKSTDALFHWQTNKDGKKLRILYFQDTKPQTIAHECLHATFNLLKDRGMTLTESSEETYTHFFERLFSAVTNGLTS